MNLHAGRTGSIGLIAEGRRWLKIVGKARLRLGLVLATATAMLLCLPGTTAFASEEQLDDWTYATEAGCAYLHGQKAPGDIVYFTQYRIDVPYMSCNIKDIQAANGVMYLAASCNEYNPDAVSFFWAERQSADPSMVTLYGNDRSIWPEGKWENLRLCP